MVQTVVKQVLTEGEKFLMTFFEPISLGEQGVYEIVNNLASLAARFILAPVEESAYLMFSSLVDRVKPSSQQNQAKLERAVTLLCHLTKAMTLVGLFIFTFGFNFSELALGLYASRQFSSGLASKLLRWQCLYILVISINGMTEGFAVAVMTERRLNMFNIVLVVLSLGFIASSFLLTKLFGSLGLVLANTINMTGRILHSILFINNYLSSTSLVWIRHILLDKKLGLSFLVTFVFLRISETSLCCQSLVWSLLHLGIGCFMFLLNVILVYKIEGQLVDSLWSYFYTKKKQN